MVVLTGRTMIVTINVERARRVCLSRVSARLACKHACLSSSSPHSGRNFAEATNGHYRFYRDWTIRWSVEKKTAVVHEAREGGRGRWRVARLEVKAPHSRNWKVKAQMVIVVWWSTNSNRQCQKATRQGVQSLFTLFTSLVIKIMARSGQRPAKSMAN